MNTRLVAAKVIVRVQDGQSLSTALEPALNALNDKDKAFVQALCYGVCRYYQRLDCILSQLLDKPLKDAEVKALALVGLYQLRYMRVKPHAAVSETVLATRKKPWAKGLLNALLRRYLREQEILEQHANTIPVATFSHPAWLIERITQDWTEKAAEILNANNQQAPMVLRVNAQKISTQDYSILLTEQGIAGKTIDFCPTAIVLEKAVAVDTLPKFFEGWVSVQDTAAQLAAPLLNLQAGQRVLDMCAAPGGKAAHILESCPELSLTAVDVDALRMRRVEDNCQRLNLAPTLIVGDAAQPSVWWDGQYFDRILLDAPCSGLGVIRRHADIKLLRRPEDIDALQAIQQQLLIVAWSLLAKGGVLLYATCSILKQENEQQIAQFLASHTDAMELPIDTAWGIKATYGRQILTGDNAMDGFFYARLIKD